MIQQVAEKPHSYYDEVYRGDYSVEHMRPVYDEVMSMLRGIRTVDPVQVLEIGCGTGAFGEMVVNTGVIEYRGFDFSAEAIRRCPNTIRAWVARRDAYSHASYRVKHNTVVAIETMEHLNDLKVVRNIKPDAICIFTFPNYTDAAHVRTYPNSAFIKKHFKGLIRWSKIVDIKMAEDMGIRCGYKIIRVCKGVRICRSKTS